MKYGFGKFSGLGITATLLLGLLSSEGRAQGVHKTADEFNKMSRSDTSLVILEGVVTRIRNNQRGAFYLRDETGEAYIYGIEDGRPGSNLSFLRMEVVEGDTLTVAGRRTVYDGRIIEMAGGHLLRKANGPGHAEKLDAARKLDRYPTFKGKDPRKAFGEWVSAHLKYPKEARDAHMDGTVLVKFVVGRNGGVQEVEVEKGVCPALDAEALRVIKSSPKWKPGIKDGRPVRVTYHHPVIFILPE